MYPTVWQHHSIRYRALRRACFHVLFETREVDAVASHAVDPFVEKLADSDTFFEDTRVLDKLAQIVLDMKPFASGSLLDALPLRLDFE